METHRSVAFAMDELVHEGFSRVPHLLGGSFRNDLAAGQEVDVVHDPQ